MVERGGGGFAQDEGETRSEVIRDGTEMCCARVNNRKETFFDYLHHVLL